MLDDAVSRAVPMIDEKALRQSNLPGSTEPDKVATRTVDASRGTEIVPILAEELSVAKEVVETGRVRLNLVTHTREELVDELLTDESAEIEHVAIGKPVDAMPSVRQEGDTTIVPVVEEEVVVQRRLVLKEEIRIRLVRTTRRHQERVVLRRQEAAVTRNPVEASAVAAEPNATAETGSTKKP